jgi:hypothetical protein
VTDIALAQLRADVEFGNIFLDSDTIPKVFHHSKDQAFKDKYIIKSFTTREQKLERLRSRFTFGNRLPRECVHSRLLLLASIVRRTQLVRVPKVSHARILFS